MLIINRLESQTIKKYFGASKAKGYGHWTGLQKNRLWFHMPGENHVIWGMIS